MLACLSNQHRSDEIRPGGDPRWAFICCYNTKQNRVDDNPGHPSCAFTISLCVSLCLFACP